MGGKASKVVSAPVKRNAKNWNVENRAFKEIEKHKDKPKQAPLHPSTEKEISQFRERNPELLSAQQIKDDMLHNRLSGMLAKPEKLPEPEGRRLPEDKTTREDPEYGYLEPKYIRKGRVSIRQALGFICDHHMDKDTHTSEHISNKYQMKPAEVENILKHFKPLQVQIPKLDRSRTTQMIMGAEQFKEQTKELLKSSKEKVTDSPLPDSAPPPSAGSTTTPNDAESKKW